jgi:hypothetical protein
VDGFALRTSTYGGVFNPSSIAREPRAFPVAKRRCARSSRSSFPKPFRHGSTSTGQPCCLLLHVIAQRRAAAPVSGQSHVVALQGRMCNFDTSADAVKRLPSSASLIWTLSLCSCNDNPNPWITVVFTTIAWRVYRVYSFGR